MMRLSFRAAVPIAIVTIVIVLGFALWLYGLYDTPRGVWTNLVDHIEIQSCNPYGTPNVAVIKQITGSATVSGLEEKDLMRLWKNQEYRQLPSMPDEPSYILKFYYNSSNDGSSMLMTVTVNFDRGMVHLYRAGGNYKDPWRMDGEQPKAFGFASASASAELHTYLSSLPLK